MVSWDSQTIGTVHRANPVGGGLCLCGPGCPRRLPLGVADGKALGLDVLPPLLARADEVVE